MKTCSRRQFLETTAIAAGGMLMLRRFSFGQTATEVAPFEFLVAGDSLMYGQGLDEKDKIYTLAKNWLERDVFAGKRAVNLKMKAHSGATLFLHDEPAAALRKAGKPENTFYNSEIPVGYPSIRTALATAKEEYDDPSKVELIMLSGGITDIAVANILNIFGSARAFRAAVPVYCNDKLYELLRFAVESFPNARVAVLGYYPMVSKRSSTHAVFNAVLEMFSFPRFSKPFLNNFLTSPILKMMRQKVINRSRFWAENSALEQRKAIARINSDFGAEKAIFVPSPITDASCVGTKNSLLWGMAKKGRTNDPYYDRRRAACRTELAPLIKNKEIDYSVRFCELAGVGHPNVEGAKAYAASIKQTLEPILLASARFPTRFRAMDFS